MALSRGIAVLGWGSLVWDLDDLVPKVEGGWAMRAGPRLPVEFSRISAKRAMGLVLCLDPADGVAVATHAIRSRRRELEAAADDLAARERAPLGRIGRVTAEGRGAGRIPEVVAAVAGWCAAEGWDGAVWTDLEPDFSEVAGRGFTVPEGIGWLRGLEGASLSEARRYIRSAPLATRTPLRRALARDPWWRGLPRGQAPDGSRSSPTPRRP